jgi:hypothetical protein
VILPPLVFPALTIEELEDYEHPCIAKFVSIFLQCRQGLRWQQKPSSLVLPLLFSECFSCGDLHRVKLHANQSIMMLGSIYISVGLALAKLLNLQIILELKFPKITLK